MLTNLKIPSPVHYSPYFWSIQPLNELFLLRYLRPTQHAWQFIVSRTEFTIFSSKLALLQESSSQEMTCLPCPALLPTDLLLIQHLGVWLNVTCSEGSLEPLRPSSSYILFQNSYHSCNYILICDLFHVTSSLDSWASRTGTVTTAHSVPSATRTIWIRDTHSVNRRLRGCARVIGMLLINHILNLFILNSCASL